MKNILILITLIITSICTSCKNNSLQADADEILVINEMNCWDSYDKLLLEVEYNQKESRKTAIEKEIQEERERNMTIGEAYAYMDAWMPYIREAEEKGRGSLYNNIEVINLIRNDSLLEQLQKERKILAESLEPFKNKVPFFAKDLMHICKYEINYKYYYKGDWGFIYQKSYIFPQFDYNSFISNETPTFYSSLNDLLKDKYSMLENSNIEEGNILELKNILISLEAIDRKLWLAIEYNNTKLRMKEWQQHWQQINEHTQRVDSIFRN